MADDKKKILIDVLLKASDSIKEVTKLTANVAALRKEQKELDTSTEEGRAAFERNAAEIRANTKEIRQRRKEIDNNIKQATEEKGSLDSLSASLSNMKAQYRAMSEEARNSAEGKALEQSILATNNALKLAEEGYGDYWRSTGNYTKANAAVIAEMEKLHTELQDVGKAFLQLSEDEKKAEVGQAMIAQMNQLQQTIDKTNSSFESFTQAQDQHNQTITSLIANNNSLVGSLLNVATTGGTVNGMFAVMKMQALAAGKALWALVANPVVLTLVAIVGVLALLAKAFQRNEENGDKMNIVLSKIGGVFQWLLKKLEPVVNFLVDGVIVTFDKLGEVVESTLDKIASALEFFGLDSAAKWVRETTDEIKEMTIASAKLAQAEAELRKGQREQNKLQKDYQRQAERLRQLRDDDTKSIAERIKANKELGKVLQQQQEAELAIANKALEVAKLKLEVEGRTTENLDAHAQALEKIADIQERITGRESEQIKSANSLRKEAADKAIESFNKTLDAKRNLDESLLRAEADYQSEDYSKRQEYERKIFELTDNTEREKLTTLRKFGKITQSEYNAQLAILDAKQKEFSNSQVKGLNDYFREQMKEISSMVEQSTTQQIADVTEKYNKAIRDLGEIQEPIQLIGQSDADFEKEYGKYKALMFEKALLEVELEEQKAKEIEAINEASIQKRLTEIEKSVSKQYQDDLDRYIDNEREKNRVEIDSINESIKQKKEAGLSTLADEAQLRSLQSQANQIQLNSELLQAGKDAEAKYQLKKAYLEKEKAIHQNNADKQLEINEQLKQAEKELLDERIAAAEQWKNATSALLGSLLDLSRANVDAEIQEYERENEEKKLNLQNRLDQGLISQEEYDEGIAQADAALDKKKKDAERKQAEREKQMKIFSVITDTAMGIAKAVSASPLTFGLPFSAFVGATGAIQLASVMSQPLPKASRGMLLSGPSHAKGGIPIEAEGGEAIINKRSTAMFAPLLSLINEVGGGVPFAKPMSDGGFSVRSNQESKNDWITRSEMLDIINKQKIYVTVEDYRRADKNYTDVKDISRNE